MAQTETINFLSQEFTFKAKNKDIMKLVYRAYSQLLYLTSHKKELRGILGVDESESGYRVFGQTYTPRDADGWIRKTTELFQKFDNVTFKTDSEAVNFFRDCQAIYDEHVYIEDSRQTPEEYEEECIENEKARKLREEERDKKKREFLAEFSTGEEIQKPENGCLVTLEVCFDNSDSMSDYYHRHAKLGEELILGVTHSKRQTEKAVRSVMERIPELAGMDWEWHTENYSMGKGNYLQSKVVGRRKQKAYDGREEVCYFFVVRMSPYCKSGYAFRGYTVPVVDTNVKTDSEVEVNLNEGKNGVEIKFNSKPESSVLSALKSLGFRWSKYKKMWYAKQSQERLQFANSLA